MTLIIPSASSCLSPFTYENEAAFEQDIVENYHLFFGEKTLFIPKSMIFGGIWNNAIPDGFLFDCRDARNPRFYIIEVELSKHSFRNHIRDQIDNFLAFFKDERETNGIIDKVYDIVSRHDELASLWNDYCDGEMYRLMSNGIRNRHGVLVLFEKKNDELEGQFDDYGRRVNPSWQQKVQRIFIQKYQNDEDVFFHQEGGIGAQEKTVIGKSVKRVMLGNRHPIKKEEYQLQNCSPSAREIDAKPEFLDGDVDGKLSMPTELDNEHFKVLGHSINSKGAATISFYSKDTNNMLNIPLRQLGNRGDIQELAPESYWRRVMGIDEDPTRKKRQKVPWDEVGSMLMQMCRHAKPFDETGKIRERGVWRDKGRIVINTGDNLVCEGAVQAYGDFESNFIYVSGELFLGVDIDNPLTKQEAEEFANIFKSLRWKNKINGSLMAGWCVCALICGFLHWRPHVWVTGAAGSGKTIVTGIIKKAIGAAAMQVQSRITEPRVRELLNKKAIPVIFDEFEENINNKTEAQRVDTLLHYFRGASSESGAVMLNNRGWFSSQSCACFFSTKPFLNETPDKSRVSTLELEGNVNRPQDAQAHWAELSDRIEKLMGNIKDEGDKDFSARLLGFIYHHIDIFIENERVINNALSKRQSRYADQMSPMLAGAVLLQSPNKVITEAQFEKQYSQHDFQEFEEAITNTDQMNFLHNLMALRIQGEGETVTYSIGHMLRAVVDAEKKLDYDGAAGFKKTLEAHGIRYCSSVKDAGKVMNDVVQFANRSHALAQAMQKSPALRGHTDIKRVLQRVRGSVVLGAKEFNGYRSRATAIPLSLILSGVTQ